MPHNAAAGFLIDTMENVLTVTELTANIKMLLETSFDILWVLGEVSNLRKPGSGHIYFTLKDEHSQIRGVIFRPAAARLGFDLEEGMSIICRGRLNVYQPRGEYQIIIDAAEPRGLGALQMAFEQLKKRLEAEGLFDPARKRAIPFLPGRIGIVTSPSGAAIRDILNITARRFPSVDILIAPVRVQGAEAPPEIARAIVHLNTINTIDVIIVTRGGGSLEDLFPFNDERVARAIYASAKPVISAVGHEIDFTIADFVADMRAPTPSAAAELVVPNRRDLMDTVEVLTGRLRSGLRRNHRTLVQHLDTLLARMKDPRRVIADFRQGLDELLLEFAASAKRYLDEKKTRLMIGRGMIIRQSPLARIRQHRLKLSGDTSAMTGSVRLYLSHRGSAITRCAAMLESLSPLSVLKRGYGIVRKLPGGTIVKEAAALVPGNTVSVKVASGHFEAEVTSTSEE